MLLDQPAQLCLVLRERLDREGGPQAEPCHELLEAREGRLLEAALDPRDGRLARSRAPRQRPLAQARLLACPAKRVARDSHDNIVSDIARTSPDDGFGGFVDNQLSFERSFFVWAVCI